MCGLCIEPVSFKAWQQGQFDITRLENEPMFDTLLHAHAMTELTTTADGGLAYVARHAPDAALAPWLLLQAQQHFPLSAFQHQWLNKSFPRQLAEEQASALYQALSADFPLVHAWLTHHPATILCNHSTPSNALLDECEAFISTLCGGFWYEYSPPHPDNYFPAMQLINAHQYWAGEAFEQLPLSLFVVTDLLLTHRPTCAALQFVATMEFAASFESYVLAWRRRVAYHLLCSLDITHSSTLLSAMDMSVLYYLALRFSSTEANQYERQATLYTAIVNAIKHAGENDSLDKNAVLASLS